MDAIALIDKYYADNPRLRELLWIHSRQVADRCLKIAALHPELDLDKAFWKKQLCYMISAFCIPTLPVFYVRETHLIFATVISGRRCCVRKGFRPCQGVRASYRRGAFTEEVAAQGLPIPVQDYYPETLEEQLICYADKFYSKSHPDREKTPEQALKSVSRYGEDGARRFRHWMELLRKISGIKRILCNFAFAY